MSELTDADLDHLTRYLDEEEHDDAQVLRLIADYRRLRAVVGAQATGPDQDEPAAKYRPGERVVVDGHYEAEYLEYGGGQLSSHWVRTIFPDGTPALERMSAPDAQVHPLWCARAPHTCAPPRSADTTASRAMHASALHRWVSGDRFVDEALVHAWIDEGVAALVRARGAQATAPRADEDRFTTDVHEAVAGVDADPTGAVQRTRLRLCDGWRLVPPAAAPGAETTTDEGAHDGPAVMEPPC